MEEKVEVSVLCLVYNQEKSIRKCLDRIIGQKTTFSYEILVYDDVSSDGSREIIDEYERKYPDIIRLVYPKENQMQKKANFEDEILFPLVRGRYIAFCEGDDYWTDPYKLQKQYIHMEQDPSCSMCAHNTLIYDLCEGKYVGRYHNWKGVHRMTAYDVILDLKVHTSSYFIRRQAFRFPTDLPFVWWCSDYTRLLCTFVRGNVDVLADVMSVYNWNNVNGVTHTYYDLEQKNEHIRELNRFLNAYNRFTDYRYDREISCRLKIEHLIMRKTSFMLNMIRDGRMAYNSKKCRFKPERGMWFMILIYSPISEKFIFNVYRTLEEIYHPD